jgi:hypothetical protein
MATLDACAAWSPMALMGSYALRRPMSQITDPTPLASGMQLKRDRGVRCICFC